ncbi:MAG: DUF4331 family protein [Polyangiaceae bacterium]
MRTKTTFALVVLGSALALVGCGDDDSSSNGGTGASAGSGGTGNTAGTGGASGAGAQGGAGAGGSGGSAGAQPRGKANPPTPGAQIDRTGRPAVSSATIETFNADDAKKDAARDEYNANSDPSTWAAKHKDQIKGSLAILDALDGTCGNQLVADQTAGKRYDFLATVLADDQLYVLTTEGTCGVYLGLEAGLVGVQGVPANCGGRMPSDDVIARSYSVLANGSLGDVDDTITADDKPASSTFPFLSAP